MTKILIATRNTHKVAQIRSILGHNFQYATLQSFPDAPIVIEDAPTFAGNATKKAVELAHWLAAAPDPSKINFVLAGHSGLEVDALNGAPGVHSARFAALDSGAQGNSSDKDNCAKLLRLLKDVPLERRIARFRCVIALTPVVDPTERNQSEVCYADEAELRTQIAEGTCEGLIILEPLGTGGFGYDPLFVPSGYEQTFAQLGEDVKNRISHRARALDRLSSLVSLKSRPISGKLGFDR